MSRVLKFRQPVWVNGSFSRWHYWGFIKSGMFTGPCYEPEQSARESQQFTGLLDRNGKEIYEGDRCNVQFADGTINRAEVVFEDGCFNLHFYRPVMIGQYRNVRDYLKCWTVNHAVEVIGNIYDAH